MKLSFIAPAAVLALAIAGCSQNDGNANDDRSRSSSNWPAETRTIPAGPLPAGISERLDGNGLGAISRVS